MYFETVDLCVSVVEVELRNHLQATPYHREQEVWGAFVLADVSAMNSSSRSNHGQRIRDTVFDHVEQIAVDIRLANQ